MASIDRFAERVSRSYPASSALTLGLGLVPGLSLLSGGLLALVTLLRGYAASALVLVTAVAVLALLGWASGTGPAAALVQPLGGPLLGVWVPAILLAAVLRASRSLALMVVAGAAGACLVVAGQLFLMAHPLAFWEHLLGQALAPLKSLEGQSDAQWQKSLAAEATLMPGVSAAAVMLYGAAMVLVGRYFQARLLRPGAFGEEFRQLSLGRVVTVLGSLVLVARIVYPVLVLKNLAIVMLAMFVFQGLAVIHALFRARHWPRAGLIVFYILFGLLPLPLAGVVSGAGLVDNWFDFRRLRASPPAG